MLPTQPFWDVCDRHVDRDGDPDLGFDRIVAGPENFLMRRCGLIHLKKSHLPAALVELGEDQ